jgi:hypothetical protein
MACFFADLFYIKNAKRYRNRCAEVAGAAKASRCAKFTRLIAEISENDAHPAATAFLQSTRLLCYARI